MLSPVRAITINNKGSKPFLQELILARCDFGRGSKIKSLVKVNSQNQNENEKAQYTILYSPGFTENRESRASYSQAGVKTECLFYCPRQLKSIVHFINFHFNSCQREGKLEYRHWSRTPQGPGKLHGIYPTLLPGKIAPSVTKGASVTDVGAISSLGGMGAVNQRKAKQAQNNGA